MTDEQIREKLGRAQDLRWRSNAGAREECEAIQRDLLRELPGILDALEAARVEIERLEALLSMRDKAVTKIVEVAHKHGWNGVTNAKHLEVFLDEALSKSSDEVIAELTSLRAFRAALTEEEWSYAVDGLYELAKRAEWERQRSVTRTDWWAAQAKFIEDIRTKLTKALESLPQSG